nr:MAG TPA: hypothetical protein [Caudoviricetes sp.]
MSGARYQSIAQVQVTFTLTKCQECAKMMLCIVFESFDVPICDRMSRINE